MKKKAVITIVGTIGVNSSKAIYFSDIPQIKQTKDINTLPILMSTAMVKYTTNVK